ncbi:MAG: hypothetical protein R3D62_03440 [Xanthobacteraceae bacterium]
MEVRIDTAISAGALPKQDAPDSAAHVLGALAEGTVDRSRDRRLIQLNAAPRFWRLPCSPCAGSASATPARGLIIQAPTILGP